MDKKKLVAIMVILALAVAAVAAFSAYSTNPTRQARKALAAGEQYLNDLEYKEAYAQFARALEIAPNDEEIIAVVNGHIDDALNSADRASAREDYNNALDQLDAILEYSDVYSEELILRAKEIRNKIINNLAILDAIEEAEKLFGEADYKGAQNKFEDALAKGADKDAVYPHYDLSKAYQRIISMIGNKEWEKLVAYIDGNDFNVVKNEVAENGTAFIGKENDIFVESKNNAFYIVCNENNTGVFVGNATYMLYEGGWNEHIASGKGILYVWNKNENLNDAVTFSGSFADGLLDGEATYNGSGLSDVSISVKKGILDTVDVDDIDEVCVSQVGNEKLYVILNEDINSETVDSYKVGAIGFGGSDEKLLLGERTFDTVPPVLKCGLQIGTFRIERSGTETDYTEHATGYMGRNIIGMEITATDNVDGDITSRITYTSQNGPESNGVYEMTVVYSVSDSAGNTSKMTVVYEHHDFHGATFWNVLSIN